MDFTSKWLRSGDSQIPRWPMDKSERFPDRRRDSRSLRSLDRDSGMSDLDSFEDLRLRVSDPGPLNLRTWRCGRCRPSTQLCFQDGSRRATTRRHEVVDWPEAPQVAHSTSQSAMPSSAVQSSPQQPGQLPKDMAFIIIMLPPKYDAGLALPSCEMERERGSVFPRGRWTEGPGEGQKGSVLERKRKFQRHRPTQKPRTVRHQNIGDYSSLWEPSFLSFCS